MGHSPLHGMDPAPARPTARSTEQAAPYPRTGAHSGERCGSLKNERGTSGRATTTARTYAKANRYLSAKRVKIIHRDASLAIATCKGDHGNYWIHGDDTGWTCTCPAHDTCSHIIATEALTQQICMF